MKTYKYKLSIIIPYYNTMELIDTLIQSIPRKEEIQIIIVDDKSDEVNSQYVKKIVEKEQCNRNIHYLYNDKIKSAGTCRNIGMEFAQGEWYLFADSDDYFVEGFYSKVENWLESEYDVVYFSPTSWDLVEEKVSVRHKRYEKFVREYTQHGTNKNLIRLKSSFVVPWSKLIRSELVESHSITFEEIRASNDVMFSIKVAFASERIASTEDIIYCVTKGDSSLFYTYDLDILNIRMYAGVRRIHFLKTVLSKKEFKMMNFTGGHYLFAFIKNRANMKNVLTAFLYLKQNRISILKRPIYYIKKYLRPIKKYILKVIRKIKRLLYPVAVFWG